MTSGADNIGSPRDFKHAKKKECIESLRDICNKVPDSYTSQRLVAFLDILGFSNYVKQEKNPRKVLLILIGLENLCNQYKKDLVIKRFSDSIYIMTKAGRIHEETINRFLSLIGAIYRLIISVYDKNTLLLRGGISYGEAVDYEKEYSFGKNKMTKPEGEKMTDSEVKGSTVKSIFMIGPAMIEAYKLEGMKSRAMYPCIVTNEKAIEFLKTQKTLNLEQVFKKIDVQDDSPIYFLDIIELTKRVWNSFRNSFCIAEDELKTKKYISEGVIPLIKKRINELNDTEEDINIKNKLKWMLEYLHNII